MSAARLDAIREIIQHDAGGRGLRTDPVNNLITRTEGDFAAACRSIAENPKPSLAIITGFYIATAAPPAAETDGPLGAIFLARSLAPLGIPVLVLTDFYCREALNTGLAASGLTPELAPIHTPLELWGRGFGPATVSVPVLMIPPPDWPGHSRLKQINVIQWATPTHLIALERVGPSHSDGRCYSMRGRDITEQTPPAHLFIEDAANQTPPLPTIGIGDGGNEIGMGKIPREVIARNIPNGDKVACRIPTDHLIVAGVSNWGAYGLAAGVRLLRNAPYDAALFDPERERELLQVMVEHGPLVDGVTGRQEATVDGLPWERHAQVLRGIDAIMRTSAAGGAE